MQKVGKPPFTWTMEGKTYTVSDVAPVSGYGRKLGVIFLLPLTVWDSDAEADKNNRAFLDAFTAAHPDHARVFGFLVARALKPDRSGGFGTIYEADVGYH